MKPTIFIAALLYGCASSNAGQNTAPPPAANALSGIAGRQLVVLPAQLLSTATPGGGSEIRADGAALLTILDQEIADAFRQRGVRSNWTFSEELIASASRNAGLAGDPLALPVAGIRGWKASDTPLPEPLASEIRTLVSLTSARYVIMPLETRVDATEGQRKGALHVLLIDARTARVLWAGDVEGLSARDPVTVRETLTPYGFRVLSRELAGLFAGMVVAQ